MKFNCITLLFVLINTLCILSNPISKDSTNMSHFNKRGAIGDIACLLFGKPKHGDKWTCCSYNCMIEDTVCRSSCRASQECQNKYNNGQRCCVTNC